MNKLTDAELRAMPPKSTRYPEEVQLYRENPFLDAYGLHTDKRIRETGYKAAIGGGDNWEQHGQLQRDFLIGQGMRPEHRLLDIGCGTGRLARNVVPYLNPGNYTGLDISHGAIAAARELAQKERWAQWQPTFFVGQLPAPEDYDPFDFIWAFSVSIHLPSDIWTDVMRNAARFMHKESQFFFSYVPEEASFRSGLKQFRKTAKEYMRCVDDAGLVFLDVPNWVKTTLGSTPGWAGGQRVARAMLK